MEHGGITITWMSQLQKQKRLLQHPTTKQVHHFPILEVNSLCKTYFNGLKCLLPIYKMKVQNSCFRGAMAILYSIYMSKQSLKSLFQHLQQFHITLMKLEFNVFAQKEMTVTHL